MAPKLYLTTLSPPARAVLLTAAAVDVKLELINVNLAAGEHLTPEYLKLNPQHTVPTLDDEGFGIWDSHAIAGYLVAKYARTDALHSKEPKLRAIIDQRLHFDSGMLFPRLRSIVFPLFMQGKTSVEEEKIADVHDAYAFLETFLHDADWLAGNKVTIADLCTVATVSTLNIVAKIEPSKYPNINRWFKKCQALPYYKEANQPGLDAITDFINSKLSK